MAGKQRVQSKTSVLLCKNNPHNGETTVSIVKILKAIRIAPITWKQLSGCLGFKFLTEYPPIMGKQLLVLYNFVKFIRITPGITPVTGKQSFENLGFLLAVRITPGITPVTGKQHLETLI